MSGLNTGESEQGFGPELYLSVGGHEKPFRLQFGSFLVLVVKNII